MQTWGYSHSNRDAYTNVHANSDFDTDCYCYCNCYSCTHAYRDTNPDFDANSNPDSDVDSHAEANSGAKASTDSGTSPDAVRAVEEFSLRSVGHDAWMPMLDSGYLMT